MITRSDIDTLESAAEVLSRLGHPVKSLLLARMAERLKCPCCGGSGRVPRDPDIGTDQECGACDESGLNMEAIEEAKREFHYSEAM